MLNRDEDILKAAEDWQKAGHGVAPRFVGVDGEGQPRAVPTLVLESDAERRRFTEAEIRRSSRLARREAITTSRSGEDSSGS